MATRINEIHLRPLLLAYFPRLLEGTTLGPDEWRTDAANYLPMPKRWAYREAPRVIDRWTRANGVHLYHPSRNPCYNFGHWGVTALRLELLHVHEETIPGDGERALAGIGKFSYIPDGGRVGHVVNWVLTEDENGRHEIGAIEPEERGRAIWERRLDLTLPERESVRITKCWQA